MKITALARSAVFLSCFLSVSLFSADIFEAAKAGDKATVMAISESDPSSVRGRNSAAETPLHYAVYANQNEMVAFLCERGADVNAKDNGGFTPLFNASLYGYSDIVATLLLHGANANAYSNAHETALHRAKNKATAKILLLAGADVNAKDFFGRTPYDFAQLYSHWEMAALIKKMGGVSNNPLSMDEMVGLLTLAGGIKLAQSAGSAIKKAVEEAPASPSPSGGPGLHMFRFTYHCTSGLGCPETGEKRITIQASDYQTAFQMGSDQARQDCKSFRGSAISVWCTSEGSVSGAHCEQVQ